MPGARNIPSSPSGPKARFPRASRSSTSRPLTGCGCARPTPWSAIRRELRRRTRVGSHFPNPESCLRLVCALLDQLDDEWMTGKIYLNLNP
ncbi:transposase [Thiobacter aerophilum]|uniref:transposase n=1 Tax=Thiobacter aerophilum TaxID=3121275 RepID=UPI003D2FD776